MKAADLRKSILQAAVQGKLVPQNPHDEPATKLLERIRKEKTQLVKEGKIKKEKPLPPISEEEIPFNLPEGWVWCRFGDVILSHESGWSPQCLPQKREGNNWGVLKVSAVSWGAFDPKANKALPQNAPIKEELAVKKGDFLISRANTDDLVARSVVVDCCPRNLMMSDKIIRLNIVSDVDKLFVNMANMSLHSRRHYIFHASGTSSSMKNISRECILNLIVPLPSLAEQRRIVTKVNELVTFCDDLETVEKELDTLESQFAEYLPKSILQAAVQGKLVPQNIHDEPADKLLERIRAEKAKLVKSGKLKKEKPLPPITEDEIPYDLPDGWAWCRLGELCNYGATNSVTPDQIGKNAWLLELEDIEKETGKLLQRETSCSRNSKSTKHVFIKGNILYSKLRPYLNKVLIAPESGYCTSEILPLDFLEVNNEYMLWFLRNPQFINYTNACSYGVKMPRLGTEDGKMAVVSLPPLAEQQRIVAKVNELLALCDALKAAHETPVGAPIAATVIPFPHQEEEPEMLMAARGAMPKAPSKALQDARNRLFED